jgi:hypothetical protein
LQKVESDFKNIMNDTAKFGMAKSFMQVGQSAGFDMTDPEEFNKFTHSYNEGLLNTKQEKILSATEPFMQLNNSTDYSSSVKKNKKIQAT